MSGATLRRAGTTSRHCLTGCHEMCTSCKRRAHASPAWYLSPRERFGVSPHPLAAPTEPYRPAFPGRATCARLGGPLSPRRQRGADCNGQRLLSQNHGARCVPTLTPRETGMQELTTEEVRGLGHAVGLEIQDPELTEVTYTLNALLEDLDHINPPGLDTVEPLPILLPPR